jgi:hypothetical protein
MTTNLTTTSDFIKLLANRDTEKIEFIDFAATDFNSLLTALTDYVKAFYPQDYNNFSESDLGVFLIELVAYMGSVMSMKADMLAHENFLQTAKNRNNVRKLLELVGVSMKGPISAVANATLTLDASSGEDISIQPASRAIVITSPEDKAPLNYTLYKTVNGVIDDVNSDGVISLAVADSESSGSLIWNNLALLEGSLISQSGVFTADNTIQTIALTETPIAEKSVQVYIGHGSSASGAWVEAENLYFASGSDDKIFQVSYNDDFTSTITFGDGNSGKNVPAGATYQVFYRAGGGSRGNISNGSINTIISTSGTSTEHPGVMSNSSIATGGSDAESVESAKKYAPLTFKTQNRLVTLEDYNTFANTFIGPTGSSAKATVATRKAYGSANIIDFYLLEKASDIQLQKASVSFKNAMIAEIELKKMITDEVVIVDGLIRTIDLAITLKIDKFIGRREEAIKASVAQKVQDYFRADNRDFGEDLSIGSLNRVIFDVQDVRFATIDNFSDDVTIEFNEIIQLNNLTLTINKV